MFAQNLDGASRTRSARAARSSSPGNRAHVRRSRETEDGRPAPRARARGAAGRRAAVPPRVHRPGRATGLALSGLGTCSRRAAASRARRTRRETNAEKAEVRHPKTEIGDWTFSNWPLYIDKKVLKDFNKEYGGKASYVEDINDNYEFFGKVRQQLENGQPIGRDIVVLTDYMAARWVRNGYIEPIDKKNVPNASNLVDNLASINYDQEREYTLPYQSGAIGVGYNIKKTGGELKPSRTSSTRSSRVASRCSPSPMTRPARCCWATASTPRRPRSTRSWARSRRSTRPTSEGQFRRFTGNDYTTDLAKGNMWVALAYSGDLSAPERQPGPALRLPRGGQRAFNDNMMMPAKVEHPYAAETMMNYVYDRRSRPSSRPTSTTSRRSRAPRRCSRRPTRTSPRTS